MYSATRRWRPRTSPSPTQVMSPTTSSSRRLLSSPSQSPRSGNGSRSNGSSSTWITTMPQWERCSSMHTENKFGQSSSFMSDRSGQPVVERVAKSPDRSGQPVVERGQELNTEHAQIRTLLDRQREHILVDCQAEIRRREFQADYDRKEVYKKLSETIESQREETSLGSSRRTSSTRSSTSS